MWYGQTFPNGGFYERFVSAGTVSEPIRDVNTDSLLIIRGIKNNKPPRCRDKRRQSLWR